MHAYMVHCTHASLRDVDKLVITMASSPKRHRVHGQGGCTVCEPWGHRSGEWAHCHVCICALGNAALLSLTVQWGNAEMYHRSGLVILSEQGLRYDTDVSVPV